MTQRKKGARHSRATGKRAAPPDRAAEDREIDRLALEGGRTKWQERSEPAAGEPPTPEELAGIDLLGRASVRGGAIEGPSEPSAESGIDHPTAPEPDQRRINPPVSDDDAGAGGISISGSGGAAGGARGSAGTSSRGGGTPTGYEEAGPGEQKSTSRFDLDHGTLDEPA